jgi:hypothetical protein
MKDRHVAVMQVHVAEVLDQHSELTGTMRGDAGIERLLSVSAAPSLETFPATSRPSTNLLGLIGR